jgi:hypothetical protein
LQATESLLNFLADRGYKTSKEKAQLCQFRVPYSGLEEMRALGKDRIHPILMFPLPKDSKTIEGLLEGCDRML